MRTSICWAAAAALVFLCCATRFGALARDYLLTAYVLQNLVLELAVALLIVLGIPKSLAARLRVPIGVAWPAGMVALALWYAPSLLSASVHSTGIEAIRVLTWIVGGVLFYLPIYSPAPQVRMKPVPQGVIYFLAALVFSSLLSVFIGFTRFGLYTPFLDARDTLHILDQIQQRWALTPEMDEQTACLLMWVLSLFVWMSSVMIMFWRLYHTQARATATSAPQGNTRTEANR